MHAFQAKRAAVGNIKVTRYAASVQRRSLALADECDVCIVHAQLSGEVVASARGQEEADLAIRRRIVDGVTKVGISQRGWR